ncbi:MAG: serine/threonine protein kinase [Verrucomicrobiaceae bacterium]|nr:serine/threonine protein kinase [Verrucomicrobiaceae bacterium]
MHLSPSDELLNVLVSDPEYTAAMTYLMEWKVRIPGYELLRLLGIGGTSWVYLARQLSLGRSVAIKVLGPSNETGKDMASVLRREGRGIAELTHPHIIHVYDFGLLEGRAYLVLEYIDAPNLAELLKGGPFDAPTSLTIAIQCASALGHAHERGVFHRDVKPSNVLMDERGHTWLLDFGIASIRQMQLETRLTQRTLAHAGSLAYMPPERLKGVTEASATEDVYSLGVLLYEMLMGFPPHGVFPPVVVAGRDCTRLNEALHRALAHDPASRWSSAGEFRQVLEEIVVEWEDTPLSSIQKRSPGGTSQAAREIWLLVATGAGFFFIQCFLIAMGDRDMFSFPAGPGSKLYDSALALVMCNLLMIGAWSALLWRTWLRYKQSGRRPSGRSIVLSYVTIVVCIAVLVTLAVKD